MMKENDVMAKMDRSTGAVSVPEERDPKKSYVYLPVDVKDKDGRKGELLVGCKAVYERDPITGSLRRLNKPQNKHERRKQKGGRR